MTYSIKDIRDIISAAICGGMDEIKVEAKVSFLLTDSRSLSFAEETLFFAIVTDKGDGHKYIEYLCGRGVRAFVVSRYSEEWHMAYPDACFLVVKDSLKALQTLAAYHRERFACPIIGITGSNGKTMVKEWLNYLFTHSVTGDEKYNVVRSPRSYNSQVGVPLSVWLLNDNTKLGIFEAGISQKGEMRALHDIIKPDIAVLTNVGAAHQEGFHSVEEKYREKLILFEGARQIVYNADDDLLVNILKEKSLTCEHLSYSYKNKDAFFFIKEVLREKTYTIVHYVHKGREGSYTLPFTDEASLQNSIICVVVALFFGSVRIDFEGLESVAMRLEVKEGIRDCTVINDAYNLDLNSLDIALDFLVRRVGSKYNAVLILSDIEQSGESETVLYTKVASLLKVRGINTFVGIGEALYRNKEIIDVREKHFFLTVAGFLGSKVFDGFRDEIILIKGARSFGFDRIADRLVKRVHETVLEVNLDNLVANYNHYHSLLKEKTRLVCMIKADGYGAGAIQIAKTLQEHNVDYLAVAVADEGVALRRSGVKSNIMVMNPEVSAFRAIFANNLEPEVYDFSLLSELIAVATKEGVSSYPIHIKIDTGMCRLGFDANDEEIDKLIEVLKGQTALVPRSVFSHFVGADADDFDTFSERQFEQFDNASRRLQNAFTHKILRHISNTAGIERFSERQLDMCRLGIGLYGIDPYSNDIINNVSTLKTRILQIRRVKKGESVGYSRRTVLDRDSLVAIIPMGYADGLNRRLGNRQGFCLVKGERAEYLGNICMDVSMVDVTDINCNVGDIVEIFGDNLPVTVLSDKLRTIPYEVLTGVSNRVNRVYFQS